MRSGALPRRRNSACPKNADRRTGGAGVAVALGARIRGDARPGIFCGRVVALYRLERRGEAVGALAHAIGRRPKVRETLLAALQEIGSDGGGIDLASLGFDFGGQPDPGDEGKPAEATEAEEIPEVDSPLDE